MGRKRSDGETRTSIVSARVTQATFDKLGLEAQKHGLSRAAYVEHLIENTTVRVVGGNADALPIVVINELKRVGNNLNQIAHARNAGADVDPKQFQTVLAEIIAVMCSDEALRRRFEEAERYVARNGRRRRQQKELVPAAETAPPMPKTPAAPSARLPDTAGQAQPDLNRDQQQRERQFYRIEQQVERNVSRANQQADRMVDRARHEADRKLYRTQQEADRVVSRSREEAARDLYRSQQYAERAEAHPQVHTAQPEPEREANNSVRATAEEILELANAAVDSIERQGRLMISTIDQKNEAEEAARRRALALRLAQQLASKRTSEAERKALDALAATPLVKPAPQPKSRWRFWK